MSDVTSELCKSLAMGMSERGNTALRNYESGDVAFYHKVSAGVWLEIVYIGENYPSWTIQTVSKTDREILEHIEQYENPWVMTKNNIGVNCDSEQSPMEMEYVLDDLESQLYSRDYKNLSTKAQTRDAVNEILKKNSWMISGDDKDRIVNNYFNSL